MPTTNCGLGGPGRLILHGPVLAVEIGFDPSYQDEVPTRPDLPATHSPALVDTGATESCIDSDTALMLNLPIVDRQEIGGAGGLAEVNVHLAQIYIPALRFTINGRFAGVHLTSAGLPYHALLGRTFLRHFSMHYDGRTGAVIISND